jgi:hypothetical protein
MRRSVAGAIIGLGPIGGRARLLLAYVLGMLVLLAGSPAPARAWAGDGLRLVAQEGGSASAVAVDRATGLAWLAVGPRVLALDIAGEEVRVVGRSEILPGPLAAIAVDGGRVVVQASPRAGEPVELWVIDGRDPSWPRRVAALRSGAPPQSPLAVGGSVLAFGVTGELQIVDLRDLARPVMAPRLPGTGGVAGGAWIEDGTAFALFGDILVRVDVTDPVHPRQSLLWPLPLATGGMAVPIHAFGPGRLAVADEEGRTHVVALRADETPREVGVVAKPAALDRYPIIVGLGAERMSLIQYMGSERQRLTDYAFDREGRPREIGGLEIDLSLVLSLANNRPGCCCTATPA